MKESTGTIAQEGKEPEDSDEDEEGVSGDHATHGTDSAEYNGMANLGENNVDLHFESNHEEKEKDPIDFQAILPPFQPPQGQDALL